MFSENQLPKNPAELLKKFPIFVLSAYYIASDKVLEYAKEYVQLGGHLVVTPRTGYANDSGRINTTVMPGVLKEVLALKYEEFSNLTISIDVEGFGKSGLAATRWIDGLIVDGAEVLARYKHAVFQQFPAVTTNKFGNGRATYIGTIPNQPFAEAISHWIKAIHNFPQLPTSSSQSVRTNSAIAKDGKLIHFAFNWGHLPAEVTFPCDVRNLVDEAYLPSGTAAVIDAWGVVIYKENSL